MLMEIFLIISFDKDNHLGLPCAYGKTGRHLLSAQKVFFTDAITLAFTCFTQPLQYSCNQSNCNR
jgi:hypothetical protein